MPLPAQGGGAPANAPEHLDAEVLAILHAQGKIAAIKHYREATGAGLREAQEAVEKLAVAAGVFPAQASGCATLVMALVATVCLAGACLIAGAGRWPW